MAKFKRGFSLVDLVLSLGLVVILVGVAYWAFDPFGRLKKSRDEVRLANLTDLHRTLERALADKRELKSTFGAPSSSVGFDVSYAADGMGWVPVDLGGYINTLPQDPLNGKTYTDAFKESVLAEYQFISDGKFYVIRTHLEHESNRALYGEDGADNSWYEVGTAPGMSTYFSL